MSQTSERYSNALFELAQEQKSLEAVQNAMTEIKKIITGSNDFRQFLSNPLLSLSVPTPTPDSILYRSEHSIGHGVEKKD